MSSLATVEPEVVLAVQNRAASAWAEEIEAIHAEGVRRVVGCVVEAVISTGTKLLEAKAGLGRDAFRAMVEGLSFGRRTAERFMAIASNPVLVDATRVSQLPPSWGTLYELARVPEPELQEALDAGRVTPATQRKDVAQLFPTEKAVDRVVEDPVTGWRPGLVEGPPCVGMQFARMAIMDLDQIQPDDAERLEAVAAVRRRLDEVAGVSSSSSCCAHVQHMDALVEAALWLTHAVEMGRGRPEIRAAVHAVRSAARPSAESLGVKVADFDVTNCESRQKWMRAERKAKAERTAARKK